MQLQQAVTAAAISEADDRILNEIRTTWGTHPQIEILGNQQAERLPIFSFAIRAAGLFLHHNFVVTLLNDVFGIQVGDRGDPLAGSCVMIPCRAPVPCSSVGLQCDDPVSGFSAMIPCRASVRSSCVGFQC